MNRSQGSHSISVRRDVGWKGSHPEWDAFTGRAEGLCGLSDGNRAEQHGVDAC